MLYEEYEKKYSSLLLLVSTMIWGSAIVITKDALNSLPFFWILAIRTTGASLIMCLAFWKRLRNIDFQNIKYGIYTGICLFLGFMFQIMGLEQTTSGKNAFLTAIYCILVPILYWILGEKRPDRYMIISSIVCTAGIGFISLEGDLSVNFGDLLTIIGAVFFALNVVVVAKCINKVDLFIMTTIQFSTFALSCWIGVIFFSDPLTVFPTSAIWQLGYLMLFATCIAFSMQYAGQKHTHPATAAVILALEAPFTVLCAVLIGQEAITLKMVIGFSLVFIAILYSETKFAFLKRVKINKNWKGG